jgi:hypothetical protein
VAKPGAALSPAERVARHRAVPSLNHPVRDTHEHRARPARRTASSRPVPEPHEDRGPGVGRIPPPVGRAPGPARTHGESPRLRLCARTDRGGAGAPCGRTRPAPRAGHPGRTHRRRQPEPGEGPTATRGRPDRNHSTRWPGPGTCGPHNAQLSYLPGSVPRYVDTPAKEGPHGTPRACGR